MSVDTPDAAALWTALRAAPNDDTLKLALADYLEENGDARTGYALRWCVGKRHWPRLTEKAFAIWYTDPSETHPGKPDEVERAMLPITFFVIAAQCQTQQELRTKVHTGIAYRSLHDAIDYLGYILAQLRDWSSLSASPSS